jgi:hypothetical protein
MNIPEPGIKVFAPGYGEPRWVVTPETGEPLVDPTIIEMRKLKTRAERLRNLPSIPTVFHAGDLPGGRIRNVAPEEKFRRYLEAINQERAALGLKSIGY